MPKVISVEFETRVPRNTYEPLLDKHDSSNAASLSHQLHLICVLLKSKIVMPQSCPL